MRTSALRFACGLRNLPDRWPRCCARGVRARSRSRTSGLACDRSSAGSTAAGSGRRTHRSFAWPQLENQSRREESSLSGSKHIAGLPVRQHTRLHCYLGAQSVWRFWSCLLENPQWPLQYRPGQGSPASRRPRKLQDLTSASLLQPTCDRWFSESSCLTGAPAIRPRLFYGVVNDSVENRQRSTVASVSMPVSMDCISQCADEQRAALHQKGALTMRRQALTLRAVDDRKDWFK